ncbi:hypothetical protein QBC46DRAFT_368798 [Diplogelasinospora grovesii]|uniref:Uncharacterized protein n=1 Tax=Diplogelasinospora grovesii TaxID=303347 RepID=A0AAN6SAQ9_9PEZI|nr:hypothetical protein QBC46DRAFT_368798 [Diplogelasinospora grovesii]
MQLPRGTIKGMGIALSVPIFCFFCLLLFSPPHNSFSFHVPLHYFSSEPYSMIVKDRKERRFSVCSPDGPSVTEHWEPRELGPLCIALEDLKKEARSLNFPVFCVALLPVRRQTPGEDATRLGESTEACGDAYRTTGLAPGAVSDQTGGIECAACLISSRRNKPVNGWAGSILPGGFSSQMMMDKEKKQIQAKKRRRPTEMRDPERPR